MFDLLITGIDGKKNKRSLRNIEELDDFFSKLDFSTIRSMRFLHNIPQQNQHRQAMWKVGDIVIGVMKHNNGIVRQIMEVRDTGVTWHYPDIPEKGQLPYEGWLGENSNDPHMRVGWEFVENREVSKTPYLPPKS